MIGHTISHYRILEELGEGEMGMGYKTKGSESAGFVAVKFLPHHLRKPREVYGIEEYEEPTDSSFGNR